MAKGLTYDLLPKIPTVGVGSLLRSKVELFGTDAMGINQDDEAMDYGGNEIIVPAGTVCLLGEENQFFGADEKTPVSAWIRWRLIAGEKIIYYTLVTTRKRIWDFETYRGKQRIVRYALDDTFEILQQGKANV